MKIRIIKEAEETFGDFSFKGKEDQKARLADDTMPIKRPEDYATNPDNPTDKEMEAAMKAYAARNSSPMEHLRKAGFDNVDFLGRGQFGYVYSGDHPSGREMAIKAVQKDNIGHDREIRAYKTIGKTRNKSELIAKHFPLIYTVDSDSHDQYSFIAMERLTDEGPYAELVNDIFSGPEGLVHPRQDMIARGAWKDLSRRMKTYFNKDVARNKIIDIVFAGTPDDYIQDIKAWSRGWQNWRDIMPQEGDFISQKASSNSPRAKAQEITSRIQTMVADPDSGLQEEDIAPLLKALKTGYYYDALQIMQKDMEDVQNPMYRRDKILKDFYKKIYTRFYKTGVWLDQMIDEYVMFSDRDAFQDELGNLKKEFEEEPWMVYFILGALKKLKEYRPDVTDPVWQDTTKGDTVEDFYWARSGSIVFGWLDFIRKQAPIGIHNKPEPERADRGGAPEEVGDSYEEVRSIRQALTELEQMTGLAARDMHDKNVMMRPVDGAIVIVDVGMFKPRSEIKSRFNQAMNEDKKQLRERFYDEIKDFDFNFDDFKPKTALHPSFWQKDKLFGNVSKKLKQIAENFAKNIDIKEHLDDILIVGSLASYNWHKKSDIDLHLVMDFDKFDKNEDMVEELMRLHRMRWNNDHNIRIYGHEVEIYVQDVDHKGHYAGIYSLKDNKWLKNPKKEDPEIDFAAISNKAATYAAEINEIHSLYRKKYVSEAYMQADGLKKKIREMRQVGLDGEGTYSVENLTFKLLRNNGFMKKLSDIKENSYDILMSVGVSPIIKLNVSNNLDEKNKKRKKGKSKVTYSKNPRSKKGYSGKNHWNVGSWWYNGSSGAGSGGDGVGGE
jgi:hypothetical protein